MSNFEATIICIDNSDYNRNEDILPNRFLSQIDCINVLCCNKTSMHYRNNIGVIMMAGDKIKVKVSLTNDIGLLLSCIHDIKMEGSCDVIRSLLIAQLALKHREDKNLEQKILLFVGSPLEVNHKQLINTGKQLKKNNIAIDIISYGNIDKNRENLKLLFENVNNNDNCRFIECPENETNLSVLCSKEFNTYLLRLDGLQHDEQLRNAMQLSLQESQQGASTTGTTGVGQSGTNDNSSNKQAVNNLPTIEDIENMKDIDNELKEALLLSLREYTEKQAEQAGQTGENGQDGQAEETPALGNENYKNSFDNQDINKIKTEENKEKKENESYEKVFKVDKEYNNVDSSSVSFTGDNNCNINNNNGIVQEMKENILDDTIENGNNEKENSGYNSSDLGKRADDTNNVLGTNEKRTIEKQDGEEEEK
ncbi:26S proteasome regulatory subunit RPN10, putative [Hepatocystis sp. ex Piliocolobus tephrosceles]|nr:26S proteasome regulatory subunit RPN10, putative [Hepatocystis sp. ex Piliocolobus tephrosceles]